MAAINPQGFLNLVVAISVFGLVLSLWLLWIVVWLFRRGMRTRQVQQRLAGLDPGPTPPARVLRLWRDGREVTTTVAGAARNNPATRWLRRVHGEAGFEVPLGSSLLGLLSVVAAVFTVCLVLSQSLWISIAAFLTALQICWIVVCQRVAGRASLFERQLVDSLELAARSLRAGHPLTGAFRLIAEEVGAPVGHIFGEVCQHQGMGASLDQAMRSAAAVCPNPDFKLFATSIVIQLQSGGNLAEMMERLAFVMRERMRLARRVRVLTAQTQFSKRILLAMPFFVFIILNLINPVYMKPLYSTSTGQTILFFSACGLLTGAFVMNRLVVLKH